MQENYEHYISRNIKAFYKRRLSSPILYLLLLAVLWFIFPLGGMLRPAAMNSAETFEDSYEAGDRYVRTSLQNLKFTGYTSEAHGRTKGYFYYTLRDGQCCIILLSPSTCEEVLPTIDHLRVT